MSEDNEWIDDNEIVELINRFDSMLAKDLHYFFDVAEFEAIIDYFLDFQIVEKAKIAIESAVQQHPSYLGFSLKSAKLSALNGDYYDALEQLNHIELIDPANDELYYSKGEIYSMMGKHELAIEEYKKAILYSETPEDIYSIIAFEYENMDDYPNAILSLKNALQLKPNSENIIHEIAFFFDITNREEEAIDFFNNFLNVNPFSKVAWFNLGIFYNQLELYEKAIEAYEYTLAIDEEYSSAYFNIANSLSGLKKYIESIEYYKKTFLYEPPEAVTYYYIGESYEKLNDIKNAIHYFRKAIELDEKFPDSWAGLGRLFDAQDSFDVAISYYKKAIDLVPLNTDFKFELGVIYLKVGDAEKSATLFSDITKEDDANVEAWINLSSCALTLDNIKLAISIIEEAINKNKDSALLWYRLAGYMYINGKIQQAYFYIETALKLNYVQHTELVELIPNILNESRFIELLGVYKN